MVEAVPEPDMPQCPDLRWLPNVAHAWYRVGAVVDEEPTMHSVPHRTLLGTAYRCECGARWWEPRDSQGGLL